MNQNQTECASSDTPETDEFTGPCICQAVGLGDQEDACPREKMAAMEMDRNALREVLKGVLALVELTDTRGWISHDQRLALLGNIRSAIPENADVEPPSERNENHGTLQTL